MVPRQETPVPAPSQHPFGSATSPSPQPRKKSQQVVMNFAVWVLKLLSTHTSSGVADRQLALCKVMGRWKLGVVQVYHSFLSLQG